jgi:flagellar biosynthesis/type III secretory pathway protein FliH
MTAGLPRLKFVAPLRDLRLGRRGVAEDDDERRGQDREREAYERGRREGERALSEQLVQQRAELQAVAQGVLNTLRQTVPQVVRDTEQTLVALALEAAQKLVANLPVSVELVEAAVHEALSYVEETAEYHVYLNPEDLALLRRVDSSLFHPSDPNARMHFHPAPEITRGGSLVKTRFGMIDAQRETKLCLLKQTLTA